MSPIALGIAGGLVSFASTATGTLLSLIPRMRGANGERSNRFSLPIDFALGIMVSASAFSLIGPAAMDATSGHGSLLTIILSGLIGASLVFGLKFWLDHLRPHPESTPDSNPRFILAAVLMLHNFPEGLASGAAVAGLGWHGAFGILTAISIQNIPEGALMVVCLSAMGWKFRSAFLGGLASGVVELLGGAAAGLLLGVLTGILPSLLALAGGAMMASVIVELLETRGTFWTRVRSLPFGGGFLALAVLQAIQSWKF